MIGRLGRSQHGEAGRTTSGVVEVRTEIEVKEYVSSMEEYCLDVSGRDIAMVR